VSMDEDMIRLIDQRIRLAQARDRAVGTCVTRATSGPDATVVFDGSTVAMPVKVLGTVFVQEGDRCVLDKYGSDWIVSGSWSTLALGEAARFQFGPSGGTGALTSGSFVDMMEILPVTFTKVYDQTYVRVCVSAGAYSSAASTSVRWAVRFTPQDAGSSYTAADVFTAFIHFNEINTHQSNYAGARATGIPAGSYTCQLRWRRNTGSGSVFADTNDLFMMEIDEAPRAVDPIL
jgi:hypothetical protein